MKAMILAYDFPPFVSVGGLRPYSWFKYLGAFGVQPVVVTRQWANRYGDERDYISASATTEVEIEESALGTIVRTPYTPNLSNRLRLASGPTRGRWIRRLITAWYEIGQYYATIGPKVELYLAARRYLTEHKIDAIVATGEPFVLFNYAARLSAEFGIPWVADYRDPWSQDRRRIGKRISRAWEANLERRVTASASAITTVSELVRDHLAQLHSGRLSAVIPNGYDPEALAAARGSEQRHDQFTIAFTGSIYDWHPVESVFAVCDDFISKNSSDALALHLVGVGSSESVEALLRAKFANLAKTVRFTGSLPNDRMAEEVAKANAFLMFNNYAYSGTKVFDYMALRRRILLCYSDDPGARRLKQQYYNLDLPPGTDERVLERMVEETKSGVIVKDAPHLLRVLTDLLREFRETGRVSCEPVGTEKYSRKAQAERLAEVLKGLVK